MESKHQVQREVTRQGGGAANPRSVRKGPPIALLAAVGLVIGFGSGMLLHLGEAPKPRVRMVALNDAPLQVAPAQSKATTAATSSMDEALVHWMSATVRD